MEYIIVFIWIVFLLFCLFNCTAPCLRDDLNVQLRHYLDDERRNISEIEMVEVTAVPLSPRSARRCMDKIVISNDNEII